MRILFSAHHPQQLRILRGFRSGAVDASSFWTEVLHHWVIGARRFDKVVVSFSTVEMSKQNSFIEDVKYALYMVDNNKIHFRSPSCHFLLVGLPK